MNQTTINQTTGPNRQRVVTSIVALLAVAAVGWYGWREWQLNRTQNIVVDPNQDPFADIRVSDGLDPLVAARYESEISGTKKLYEEKPGIWETWIAIGNLKNLLGDYEGAIAAYQKSLEITHNNILAYRNIAEVYWRGLADPEQAVTYYELAVNQNFTDIELYTALGQLYHKQLKDPEKALNTYRRALSVSPLHPDILSAMITLYKDTENTARYVETVREIRRAYPNEEIYRTAYQDVPLE